MNGTSEFLDSLARLTEVTEQVERKVKAIQQASKFLEDWRNVIVTSLPRNVDLPPALLVSPTAYHISSTRFPTADELSLALEQFHKALKLAQENWAKLPEGVRKGFPEPK